MYVYPLSGIYNGIAKFNEHARNLADFENADSPRDLVGIQIARQAVSANIAALRTALEMHNSIIDLLA